MRKLILVMLTWGCYSLSAPAQTAREEIDANHFLAGNCYLDYDRQLPTQSLTPSPKGYVPYYISHYGRHGSRWLLSDNAYSGIIRVLKKAQEQGKLTAVGTDALRKLEEFYPCTIQRVGDLSPQGERQHHGIGRRMVEHFPEIFKTKGLLVDARSTVVIRCILSMTAECEELAAANPTARIHNDVSESLQYYLNQPRRGIVKQLYDERSDMVKPLREQYLHPEGLMNRLFNDPQWATDSIKGIPVMRQLFEIASNMQSHDTDIDLWSLFTTDEIYDLWRERNMEWYLGYGAAPQSNSVMPFTQRNLLRNIIETADTVRQTQATLRFGHEVCVMPLACLLEMDSCGIVVDDLSQLDTHWRNYRIFPMACNIQLVFYRPKKGKGDILVKALLNEREVSLPVKTEQYPYYKWADLRAYYLEKLRRFEEQYETTQ